MSNLEKTTATKKVDSWKQSDNIYSAYYTNEQMHQHSVPQTHYDANVETRNRMISDIIKWSGISP